MTNPSDRLALLDTFRRIAEAGSISAAARDLGVSQASVSRRLAQLERRFGETLVRRTTHALSLTAAGEALLSDAAPLLSAWEALEDRHGPAGGLAGPLRVVAPVGLGQLQLAGAAARFVRDHPRVRLDWRLQDGAVAFAEAGLDAWLKIGEVPDETLVVRPLGRVERLLAAAPALLAQAPEATPEAAARLPFAALSAYGAGLRLTGPAGETRTVAPAQVFATDNLFALREAAREGAAAAVLPRWFIEEDLAEGRLADAAPGWRGPDLGLNLAWAPGPRPARLDAFLAAMTEAARALPGLLPPA